MIVLYVLLALYLLFILYTSVMNILAAHKAGRIKPAAYPFAVSIFVLGVLLDLVVNLVIFTILFLEIPQHWLVTKRLASHKPHNTWRGKLARWICETFLNPFDPTGDHCR